LKYNDMARFKGDKAMKRDVLIASLAAFSMIALATPAAAKAQQEEAGAGASKAEKKICKTFQNSASRMKSTRLCLTKADWKKFDEQR
jgi:hypothetical protein